MFIKLYLTNVKRECTYKIHNLKQSNINLRELAKVDKINRKTNLRFLEYFAKKYI